MPDGRRRGAGDGQERRGRGRGPLAAISEAMVEDAMDERTVEKGEAYLEGGNVLDAVDLGDALWGRVQGRQSEPYGVTIRLSGGGLSARCSCPMEAMCKHCAALALMWARNPESFVDGGAVLRSIEEMERDELVSRLKGFLRSDPSLLIGFRDALQEAREGQGSETLAR